MCVTYVLQMGGHVDIPGSDPRHCADPTRRGECPGVRSYCSHVAIFAARYA